MSTILVLEQTLATAFPRPPNRFASEVMPIGEALTREHGTDAHLGAYVTDNGRRAKLETIGLASIEMLLLVGDVDDPVAHADHTPARPEWRASERRKIEQLRERHPEFFVYETRGGYRLVVKLPEPIAIATKGDAGRWKALYFAFCRYIAREFNIVLDDKCNDFSRLYRLPNVVRDGVRETLPTYGDAHAIGAFDTKLLAPIERATKCPSWVRKALESAADNVRSAAIGSRNEVLNREAYSLGGYVPKYLDREEVRHKLHTAILSNGGDPDIDQKKIDDAIDAGIRAPRSVPAMASGTDATFTATLPLTDTGNAERFAADHRESLRFCFGSGRWFGYDGKVWRDGDTGSVHQRGKQTVRGIYAEAATIADDNIRRAVADHARKSESRDKRKAMIELAQSEPGIAIDAAALDRDLYALNVRNGTIDLRTGKLRPHDPSDLITKLIDLVFDVRAVCPSWDRFLEEVVPDADVRVFLQRFVGYCLTGDVSERAFLLLLGLGRNGKSVFVRTVRTLLGAYATYAPPELLMAKHGEAHPTEVAGLWGVRLASCSEVKIDRGLDEEQVKRLTGNEPIKARFMRQDFFEFMPQFKIMVAANHRPPVRDTSESIWDRIIEVPFTVRITDEKVDPHLFEKLVAEMPGILAWAVQGCLAWQREGLARPRAVREATAAYRDSQDVIARFVVNECAVGSGANDWVSAKSLHDRFVAWSRQTGEDPLHKRAFGEALAGHGFVAHRTKTARIWRGLRLTSAAEIAVRAANDLNGDAVTQQGGESRLNGPSQTPCETKREVASPHVTTSPVELVDFDFAAGAE